MMGAMSTEAGMQERVDNLPDADDDAWTKYRAKLQSIAESFRDDSK